MHTPQRKEKEMKQTKQTIEMLNNNKNSDQRENQMSSCEHEYMHYKLNFVDVLVTTSEQNETKTEFNT